MTAVPEPCHHHVAAGRRHDHVEEQIRLGRGQHPVEVGAGRRVRQCEFRLELFGRCQIEVDEADDLDPPLECRGFAERLEPASSHTTAARENGAKHHDLFPPTGAAMYWLFPGNVSENWSGNVSESTGGKTISALRADPAARRAGGQVIGIKRLARHLDMSISTVSRALNGAPDASEATQKRVRAAAEELGYVPNQSGRSLRRGITGAIGFVMQTGPEVIGQGDTFFISVLEGVQTVLARHHLDLVALLCPTNEDPDKYLRRMVSRAFVDGVIISNTRRVDPRIDFLASRRVPFVTFGRSLTDAGQPWLDIDFEAMAKTSMDRLVAKGHRRIAITMPHADLNFTYVFLAHARAALAAHGIELDPTLVLRSFPDEGGGYDLAGRLVALDDRPTAVVVLNEPLLPGLYRGLTEHNYLPGRDIAVISRDGPQSKFLSPTLTRFSQSLGDLGTALGEALLASMPRYADRYPTGLVRKVWPEQLVEGESDAVVLKRPPTRRSR